MDEKTLILFLLLALSPLASCQDGVCANLTSTVQMSQVYVRTSSLTSYSCGIFSWSSCYRVQYSMQLVDQYSVAYHTVPICCEGYTGDGEVCTAVCDNCTEPFSCVAPNVCVCQNDSVCVEPPEPQSVRLWATGADRMVMRWEPPGNFTITSYMVYRQAGGLSGKQFDHNNNTGDGLRVEISPLSPYTTYTYCVVARTAYLSSLPVCVSAKTLEAAPGDSPQSVFIAISSPFTILVTWDPPLTPNGVIIWYTIYINTMAVLSVDGRTTSAVVDSLSANTQYGVRVSASTQAGEGPVSEVAVIVTPESTPDVVQNMTVEVLSESSVHVSWDPPITPNGVIIVYQVVVTDLLSSNISRYLALPLKQQHNVSGLHPYTPYSISVAATTNVGVGKSQETLIYTKEGVPVGPPENVTTSRTSATTAAIEWDRVPLKDLRGLLVSYQVGYQRLELGDRECSVFTSNSSTLATDGESYSMEQLDPGLQYCVKVAARNSAGVGPPALSLVPWFMNTVFMVMLEKARCADWILNDPVVKMEEIALEMSSGINHLCSCDFSTSYINDRDLTCDEGILIYKGRIVSTNETSSSDLKMYLDNWVSAEPVLLVGGEELKVVGPPPGNDTSMMPEDPTGSMSETNSTTLYGSIAGAVAGLLTILLSIVTVCICCFLRHKLATKVSRDKMEALQMETRNVESSYGILDTYSGNDVVRKEPPEAPDVLSELMQEMSVDGLFVPETSITIRSIIGEGEFGVVYKAILHDWKGYSDQLVAAKTLKGMFTSGDVKRLAEESQIMARFDHPNVMKLLGVSAIRRSKTLFVIMPFMAQGNLLSYLRKNRVGLTVESEEIVEMREETRVKLLSMCLQIAKGMEYLAHNKFVHRDLAARNCMIDLNNVIKVADFGLTEDTYARNYFRQTTEGEEDGEPPVKLPVKWMALESLNDGIFSEKTDVWAFGVTCWEVFSLGKNPYPGVDPFSLIRYLERGERLDKPLNAACSQEIYDMTRECWEGEPWKRPNFSQLVTLISTSLERMAGYLDLKSTALN